jgi:ComF family protein
MTSLIASIKTLSAVPALILGQRCAACAAPCTGSPVCPACTLKAQQSNLQHLRCRCCATPLAGARYIANGSPTLCGLCISQPPSFDTAICVGDFSEPLGKLIAELKFSHHLVLSRWFATQLSPLLQALEHELGLPFDIITPIPLHPNRLRERGFNQAWEIIKHLPYPAAKKQSLLQRLRDTPSQRSLNAADRFANVKNAFDIEETLAQNPHTLQGKHVLLIDDVITTTATMQSASLILKAQGVARISIAGIARVGD